MKLNGFVVLSLFYKNFEKLLFRGYLQGNISCLLSFSH